MSRLNGDGLKTVLVIGCLLQATFYLVIAFFFCIGLHTLIEMVSR